MTSDLKAERLATLARLVDDGYNSALGSIGGKEMGMGYTLFLGRSYAELPRGIVMLGINPGKTDNVNRNATLQRSNWLLDRTDQVHLRYWTNARRLFNQHGLTASLENATFSFCCPYRTPTWVGLSAQARSALVIASRPVLQQMIRDCEPRLVIVAGITGETLFREVMGHELVAGQRLSEGPYSGTYRWRATTCTWGDQQFTVAQIPHLSRANSKAKLAECALWLSTLAAND